jgi:hypothetical protein
MARQDAKEDGMKKLIVLMLVLMSGCNNGQDAAALSAANKRMDAYEANMKATQLRLDALDEKLRQQKAPEWILWSRFQAKSNTYMVGYAPPQPVSAFSTKQECTQSAEAHVAPGGGRLSSDPIQIEYDNGTQYFYCLPRGQAAGFLLQKQ